ESVVAHFDHFGIFNSSFVERLVVKRAVKLLYCIGRHSIAYAKEHKLRVEKIVDRGSHCYEEWVLAQDAVLIQKRQYFASHRPRKDCGNHDDDLVFALPPDHRGKIAERSPQEFIVEVHSFFRKTRDTLVARFVRCLNRYKDNLRVMN